MQGAVSRNNKLVALEDRNGTSKMINKIKKSVKNLTGVLVKFPKKNKILE